MKVNKTYRSMLDKSISSMLSAIEIYNKPNFLYREESFAILAINAWELVFKAYLLRKNHYKLYSIYELENKRKKDGSVSSRKQPKLNRCGNPQSISIYKAVEVLKFQNELPTPLVDNIYSIIELRDNSIHFINTRSITKQIQEFRDIKPTTAKKLVHYMHDGAVYETTDEIPPEGDIEILPIKYDAIQFYVGYNTNRDSALVEVKDAVVEFFIDEDGKEIEYEYRGDMYIAAQIVYELGEILEKNIY